MCGRYTHMYTWEEVHAFLCLDLIRGDVAEALYGPHYNVAPTQSSLVARARADGKAELVPMKWGFVPAWAKDNKRASINARAETVATNGVFRAAFKQRRCLVPLSGFYEWQALEEGKRKQPWYFYPAQGALWAIGGIWETWGEADTFALITTAANEFIAPLHDRMPLILPREAQQLWLFGAPDEAAKLMAPAPGTVMAGHMVSDRVNRPKGQGPELIQAITP
jgi:putative SOS response-associated peptidase YedK